MGTWTHEQLRKRDDRQLREIADRVANRVAKWRSVFTGWQLGTRLASDPESQAVRDQRELLIMLRAEVNALTAACAEAGVFTVRTYTEHVILELEALDAEYERRFPGMRATDDGITMSMPEAAATMQGWLP